MAGHIGHTTIPVWLEAGYDEVIRMFNDHRGGPSLIMSGFSVDCLAELFYAENVEVRSWIDKIGRSSFVVYQEIHQGGRLCTRGATTFINFDYKNQRTEPIPQNLRLRLEEHLRDG